MLKKKAFCGEKKKSFSVFEGAPFKPFEHTMIIIGLGLHLTYEFKVCCIHFVLREDFSLEMFGDVCIQKLDRVEPALTLGIPVSLLGF